MYTQLNAPLFFNTKLQSFVARSQLEENYNFNKVLYYCQKVRFLLQYFSGNVQAQRAAAQRKVIVV